MTAPAIPSHEALLKILDVARWAPSGDNTQPWRFEIVDADHIAIHGFDTRDEVVYDFDGHASHMAHGALLETMRIAASSQGLNATWSLREDCPERAPIYDIRLTSLPIGSPPDPLVPFVGRRVVQRRTMSTTPLTQTQKDALVLAVGEEYELRFMESFHDRRKIAGLLWDNAFIRLTSPEAYEVHRAVIEWGARYSKDRIPDKALGVDPITARIMKWVMKSWKRVEFFNRYLFGTVAPRIQMDMVPALGCAAHLLLCAKQAPVGLKDHVRAGIALQRLWLTATAHGLYLQPELTPIIFRWYVRAGRSMSIRPEINTRARLLTDRFETLMSAETSDAFVFFCRVGRSTVPDSRSTRKELNDLMYP